MSGVRGVHFPADWGSALVRDFLWTKVDVFRGGEDFLCGAHDILALSQTRKVCHLRHDVSGEFSETSFALVDFSRVKFPYATMQKLAEKRPHSHYYPPHPSLKKLYQKMLSRKGGNANLYSQGAGAYLHIRRG